MGSVMTFAYVCINYFYHIYPQYPLILSPIPLPDTGIISQRGSGWGINLAKTLQLVEINGAESDPPKYFYLTL